MSDDALKKQWEDRFAAVSRVQARYLFFLFSFGVFFLATLRSLASTLGDPEASRTAVLPVFGIEYDQTVVLAAAPTVLLLLVNAYLGSLRAAKVAARKADLAEFEAFDVHPTLIDMIVYHGWSKRWFLRDFVPQLSYPLVIALFVAEACYLQARVLTMNPRHGWLWSIACVVLLGWCLLRFVPFAWHRIKQAYGSLRI